MFQLSIAHWERISLEGSIIAVLRSALETALRAS